MTNRNPFRTLGVSPDAEIEVVRGAYRALAHKYHPDANLEKDSAERMAEINWAMDELERNPDQWRNEAVADGGGAASAGKGRTGRPNVRPPSIQPARGLVSLFSKASPQLLGGLAVVTIVVVGLAFLLARSGGGGGSTKGHYDDGRLRYSFDYPKNWADVTAKVKVAAGKSTPNLLSHAALGSFDESTGLFSGVQVSVVQTTRALTDGELDDLFQQFSASVKGRQNEPQDGTLGGQKARQYVVEFVHDAGGAQQQIATAQTVTFMGDREYTVNCQGLQESFDTDIRPGCEQALQTFQFSH
jgi:DnaJ-like protein